MMKMRSLGGSENNINIHRQRTYERKKPSVATVRTREWPDRWPKCAQQVVVSAESPPTVMVMMVWRRAARACTTGLARQGSVGIVLGSVASTERDEWEQDSWV